MIIAAIVTLSIPMAARTPLGGDAIPGRYIAAYTGSPAAAARAAARLGGTVVFNHAGAGILIVQSAPANFASRLSGVAGFSHVLADRWIVHDTPARAGEEDTLAGMEAARASSFASSPFGALLLPHQWNIFRTQTERAWAITQGDPSVKVAIVDSGICMHHNDLAGKIDLELSTSFVPSAEEPPEIAEPACVGCPAWEDRNGHGSWVASVVSTNNLGMAGVAPDVRLVAIKVLDHRARGMVSRMIQAILYAADAGIDVVNVSLTFGEHPIPEFPRGMALLQRTMAYATRRGALVVIGSGNNGVDLDHAGNALAVPCDSTNGMCIGATTISDALATYSNHGVSAVTMVAPGGGLPTHPFPDTILNANVIVACSVHAIEGSCPAHIYIPARGTSFAAPMTSGAAALVIASKPHLKGRPQQVKALLASSADDLGKAGTDILFSRGRLNTLRAVQ